jgi:hypothetical protein
MFLRNRLFGSTILRAPENDQGATFDDPADPDFDDLDPDLPDDWEPDGSEDVEQEDGGNEPAEEPAPRSRATNRVAEATRQRNEERQRADSLQAELDRMRSERNQPPRETPEQRAERIRLMSPDERTDFLLREQHNHFEDRFARLEFESRDSADRTAFEGLCARSPVAAKLKDDVERTLADMRKSGSTAPRETVLKYLIGDRALTKAPAARTRQVNRAEGARTANAARPTGGRSDTQADRRGGNDREARARRLENVKL